MKALAEMGLIDDNSHSEAEADGFALESSDPNNSIMLFASMTNLAIDAFPMIQD